VCGWESLLLLLINLTWKWSTGTIHDPTSVPPPPPPFPPRWGTTGQVIYCLRGEDEEDHDMEPL